MRDAGWIAEIGDSENGLERQQNFSPIAALPERSWRSGCSADCFDVTFYLHACGTTLKIL
jgi:hypothetical protein